MAMDQWQREAALPHCMRVSQVVNIEKVNLHDCYPTHNLGSNSSLVPSCKAACFVRSRTPENPSYQASKYALLAESRWFGPIGVQWGTTWSTWWMLIDRWLIQSPSKYFLKGPAPTQTVPKDGFPAVSQTVWRVKSYYATAAGRWHSPWPGNHTTAGVGLGNKTINYCIVIDLININIKMLNIYR